MRLPSPRVPRRGYPELLVGDDPRELRFDGSGASSATTPIAPARLCPARNAEASTSRFSGSCSAKLFRTLRARLRRTQRLSATGGTKARNDPEGPRSTALRARRARARREDRDPHIRLGLCRCGRRPRPGEALHPAPAATALALPAHRRQQMVDLLPPLVALVRREVTNSPSLATSSLFGAEAPERAKGEREEHRRAPREAGPAATTASARRGTPACMEPPSPSRGCVPERDGLQVHRLRSRQRRSRRVCAVDRYRRRYSFASWKPSSS